MSGTVVVEVGADPASLSRRGRIDLLAELERAKAQLDATQLRVLAALADDGSTGCGDALGMRADRDWVREEVACALRVSGPTAAARLSVAREVTTRLPDTLAALSTGRVSAPMARRLAESVAALDDETATRVQARVLPRAERQTFSQFRQALRRAVLHEDSGGQQQRHVAAAAGRRVYLRDADDGMAELWAILPADAAAACWHALDDAAADLHSRGAGRRIDDRTADQRRADAFVSLVTSATADPAGPTRDDFLRRGRQRRVRRRRPGPAVQVTVALSTLLGLDDQPGELAGHGPVPAELARRIATDPSGTWRRLVTDECGRLVDYGRTRYRPPAALINHVRARDVTCRFPICARRAVHCEIDHVRAREDGGGTAEDNLHPLCPRHHHLKHEAGWTVTRRPDGATEWTSPTGHRYVAPPELLPVDTTLRRGPPDEHAG